MLVKVESDKDVMIYLTTWQFQSLPGKRSSNIRISTGQSASHRHILPTNPRFLFNRIIFWNYSVPTKLPIAPNDSDIQLNG